jgi:hypothetical protein
MHADDHAGHVHAGPGLRRGHALAAGEVAP